MTQATVLDELRSMVERGFGKSFDPLSVGKIGTATNGYGRILQALVWSVWQWEPLGYKVRGVRLANGAKALQMYNPVLGCWGWLISECCQGEDSTSYTEAQMEAAVNIPSPLFRPVERAEEPIVLFALMPTSPMHVPPEYAALGCVKVDDHRIEFDDQGLDAVVSLTVAIPPAGYMLRKQNPRPGQSEALWVLPRGREMGQFVTLANELSRAQPHAITLKNTGKTVLLSETKIRDIAYLEKEGYQGAYRQLFPRRKMVMTRDGEIPVWTEGLLLSRGLCDKGGLINERLFTKRVEEATHATVLGDATLGLRKCRVPAAITKEYNRRAKKAGRADRIRPGAVVYVAKFPSIEGVPLIVVGTSRVALEVNPTVTILQNGDYDGDQKRFICLDALRIELGMTDEEFYRFIGGERLVTKPGEELVPEWEQVFPGAWPEQVWRELIDEVKIADNYTLGETPSFRNTDTLDALRDQQHNKRLMGPGTLIYRWVPSMHPKLRIADLSTITVDATKAEEVLGQPYEPIVGLRAWVTRFGLWTAETLINKHESLGEDPLKIIDAMLQLTLQNPYAVAKKVIPMSKFFTRFKNEVLAWLIYLCEQQIDITALAKDLPPHLALQFNRKYRTVPGTLQALRSRGLNGFELAHAGMATALSPKTTLELSRTDKEAIAFITGGEEYPEHLTPAMRAALEEMDEALKAGTQAAE